MILRLPRRDDEADHEITGLYHGISN